MTTIHPVHQQIQKLLDNLSPNKDPKERDWVKRYLGTNKSIRCFKTGDLQKLAKTFSPDLDLINSLYHHASTFEEMVIAAQLVGWYQKQGSSLDLSFIDDWLNYTVGWAETDVLCQSNFTAGDLLNNWPAWEQFLIKLSSDANIHKRRASLVLLCKPLRQSDDNRLSHLAFKQVEKLKQQKEILITKAISWILRSLVKFHSDQLTVYLKNNRDTLPRIAYRETFKKLTTGRKN